MQNKEYSLELGGKKLTFKFLNWAERTNSSVITTYGDSTILTTVAASKKDIESSYFPLIVEYREKYYASGKIGGGRFNKREGRPSDDATLKARITDRAIRPLFNHSIRREVQVVHTILSYDETREPDVMALCAASLSILVSSIPWNGPLGAVRIGRIDGNWVINPSNEEQEKSDLNVLLSGTKNLINMLEVDAKEAPENDVLEAIKYAQQYIETLIDFQKNIQKELGKEKESLEIHEANEELKKEVDSVVKSKLEKLIFETDITEYSQELEKIHDEAMEHLKEKYTGKNPEYINHGKGYLEKLTDSVVHEAALKHNKRVDGRQFDEIRPLSAEIGLLPRTHGSGLFMRGLTHALSTVTLDSPGKEELSDAMEGEAKKRFMHHYNFPPYSTGETGFFRGPGRREIGHGALAEKALKPLIPSLEEFPYVIRVVTEILSSNGSTSMASTCGSSLALMHAGVPIKKHAAGIAMGLMMFNGDEKNAKILTDIQGPEDHFGDMDFKAAGTRDGITAVQMDVKIQGVTPELLEKTLQQAKIARDQILDTLESTIKKPNKELSTYAPIIERVTIDPALIGLVIGPGGKVIKEIMLDTSTGIEIENDGSVYISGKTKATVQQAVEIVKNLTRKITVGEIFDAKVVRLVDFGAFVELIPGQEALVHISEVKNNYIKNIEDVLKVGDRVQVKVIGIDDQGKIKGSIKQVTYSGQTTQGISSDRSNFNNKKPKRGLWKK